MPPTPKERADHIEALLAARRYQPDGATEVIRFMGRLDRFPIIRVDTRMLVYRMKNGRTKMEQMRYVAENGLPHNFFADEESAEVQNAQHAILLDMVNDQGLREDLETSGQEDPLIITSTGVVLNGNRRLAAAREARRPDLDAMECIVLPSTATEQEIYALEVELQMAEDFKAPYSWVNELLTIREGIDTLRLDRRDLAEKMRLSPPTPQQVNKRLNVLDMIDLYLARLGKPDAYYLIGEEQKLQAFTTIADRYYTRTMPEPLRDAYLARAFTLVDSPPIRGRLYDHLRWLADHIDSIVALENEGVKPPEGRAINEPPSPSDDPIVKLLETEEGARPQDFRGADYRDPCRAVELSEDLAAVVQKAAVAANEEEEAERALHALQRVRSQLESVVIDEGTASETLSAIDAELERIVQRAQALQRETVRRRGSD